MRHPLDPMSLLSFIPNLFSREPIRLAIVRRYQDANGAYVGELYMEVEDKRLTGYAMIGASLDTLPACATLGPFQLSEGGWTLDTRNDFLAPMVQGVIRVGGMTPEENEAVKQRIARLPRRRMIFTVQTRLMHELVLEPFDAPRPQEDR